MKNLNQIESEVLEKIKKIKDHNSYNLIKTEIFGKKGVLPNFLKKLVI